MKIKFKGKTWFLLKDGNGLGINIEANNSKKVD
jgi:hypothetical protein